MSNIFKISGTTKMPKDKAATFQYKTFETKSEEEFIDFINTHAICPATFKKGHRKNENITEVHSWFRIDVDKPKLHKKIDGRLKKSGIFYIKKPSTNNDKYKYKWHYLIPASEISQDLDSYKGQYFLFLSDMNIDVEWIDQSLNKPVQNMNPYKHGKGVEDARKLTKVVMGDSYIAKPFKAPKKPKIEHKELKGEKLKDEYKKAKQHLKKLDPNMSEPKWFQVAQSLHTAFGDAGFKLFDEWSSDGDDYTALGCANKWQGMADNTDNVVTLGSLLTMNKYGVYEPPKEEDVFGDCSAEVAKRREEFEKSIVKVEEDKDMPNVLPEFPKELKALKMLENYANNYKMITNEGVSKISALSVVSMVASGKCYTFTKAPTALYIGGIAKTGAGKDPALKITAEIGDIIGVSVENGSGIQSSQALDTTIRKSDSDNLQLNFDEFGTALGAMVDEKNSTKQQFASTIRTLYSINKNQTYKGATYSDGGGRKDVEKVERKNLHVSILGMTTLRQLTDKLTESSLGDGTLNRFVMIDASAYSNRENALDFVNMEMPKILRKHIDSFTKSRKPKQLPLSKTAMNFYRNEMAAFQLEEGKLYAKCSGDERKQSMLIRVAENGLRLATALAYFENMVKVPHWLLKWSYEFVANNMLHFFNQFENRTSVAVEQENNLRDKFLKYLKSNEGWHTKTNFHNDRGFGLRVLKAEDRNKFLNVLVADGLVEFKKEGRREAYKWTKE